MVVPAFSWTGCYIGGFVGGAWTQDDATTYPVGAPYGYAYKVDSSVIGGGTLGCNWQPVGSQFVLGLEGELGYMKLEGSAYNPLAGWLDTSSTKVGNWYGMITGRLGYSWDRALLYVKGGAAFVDVETALYYPGYTTASNSETVATWTVGGGIEYALDFNWSIKAEYLYLDLGREEASVAFLGTPALALESRFTDHIARIGANYRFPIGGAAPVMARY